MKSKKQKKTVKGFQVLEDECVWMKAGVVNFRLCDNAFDCRNCGFDRGMQKSMSSGQADGENRKRAHWADQLKTVWEGTNRLCRHALTGRIDSPKICPLNYECYHCPFDQMLDEMEVAQMGSRPECDTASGFLVADGYYYHMGHTWARFEHGGRIKVGFDDFLTRIFGPADSFELPPVGAKLKKDQAGLTLGRDGRTAAVLSPITGTVLATNYRLIEHPDIAHADPYFEGWLFIVEPDMPKKNIKGLFYGKESIKWIEKEAGRLEELMGKNHEKLAPADGSPVKDIYGTFPEIGWDVMAETFLGTKKA